MSTTDPWVLYAETRDRFVELMRSLDAEQASRRIPLSPDWTVTDVASHVCGINSDVASGRLEHLGTDARTAHHVAQRAGHSLDEICDEWIGHEVAVRRAIEADPFFGVRLAGDLIVHLQDVQHALGLPIDRNDEATVSAAHRYVRHLQERVLERLGIGLAVELTDGSRYPAAAGSNGSSVLLRASPYDFLRSVTGRRSRAQVEALEWTGDPTAVLDEAWSSYGPLPQDDVEV